MNKKYFKTVFPYTIPVLTGYLFLGMAYGIYMNTQGFSFLYPLFMSTLIYAGSMQFVATTLLLSVYEPISAFLITLMVNARHIFYGLSMLNEYKEIKGIKKLYLIFSLTDETFSLVSSINLPSDINKESFYFHLSLLNHSYWIIGSLLGGIIGDFIFFDTTGIEFVMTALFVVIYVEQYLSNKDHNSSLIGLFASFLCLFIFGKDSFLIPAMLVILLFLSFPKRKETLS